MSNKYLVLDAGRVVDSSHDERVARTIAENRVIDFGSIHAVVCVIAEYDMAKPKVCVTNYPVPMWARNGCVQEGNG